MEEVPGWLQNLGCYVAAEGEVVRYLGHPIGWEVKETQKCDYALGKMQRRLGSWTFRMLSFAGRMIVMKHVLKAMPNHLFTGLFLNQKALDQMEAICRKFLWGKNDSGADRVPLIAWAEITKSKGDGGLAATSFAVQGKAMRLKALLKTFTKNHEDWHSALQAILQHATKKKPGGTILQYLSLQEILMACNIKRIPKAQTATGLTLAWNEAKRKLKIETEDLILEGHCHPTLYLSLAEDHEILSTDLMTQIKKSLKKAKIHSIRHWIDWACTQNFNRPLQMTDTAAVEHGLNMTIQSTWLWKVIQQGIPTYERTQKWGHGDGRCSRCELAIETVEHLFWTCPRAKTKWENLRYLADGLTSCPPREATFLAAMDAAFNKNLPERYLLFVAEMKSIWRERNAQCDSNQNLNLPSSVTIRLAPDMTTARLMGRSEEHRDKVALEQAKRIIGTLLRREGGSHVTHEPQSPSSPQS
ncbi:hypothetical protein R1sor_026340 [Riccia sorocarpa]|uniref:Reverse transcriptase zinc-binding domain-containing protein n=1 Tax=Riccia sorocarpa TaxID=122646 RepID=A0ABD3GCU7_9MARC